MTLYYNSKNNQQGFTVVELLVTISIISLLSTIVLSGLTISKQKAKAVQIVRSLKEFQSALEFYYIQNGDYPAQRKVDSTGIVTFPGVDVFDAFNVVGDGHGNVAAYEAALQPLVTGGFIASIPHYPTFPNNAERFSGGFFEYETDAIPPPQPIGDDSIPGVWYCGDTSWETKGYALLVGSPFPLNLPPLRSSLTGGDFKDWSQYSSSGLPWYYYCITSL
jgi:prepilin-type N-terminal cleavage/methylation domain-containing protein